MGDGTGISWTDATWNPVRGCSKVSPGCTHCYAERVAVRFCGVGQPYEGLADRERGRWTGDVRIVPEHLADPLRWKKPRRIFVNSMSDLFHEKLTNEQIAAVFGVMAAAPQHTFQVLTKRAKRMREWFEWLADDPAHRIATGLDDVARFDDRVDARLVDDEFQVAVINYVNGMSTWRWHIDEHPLGVRRWPLPNVWLGVSVENQEAAEERIPELLATPATVRFLSCEPLLGPVNLRHLDSDAAGGEWCQVDGLTGAQTDMGRPCPPLGARVDWLIAGCESGPGARTCAVAWLRSLRDQCAVASVPFFLKQGVASRPGVDLSDEGVVEGLGSKRKAGGVIELPYLDGVQHAAFPVTR